MPNGKPGDHPYTDIVIHRMAIFGPTIDNLVRDIDRFGGDTSELSDLLWQASLKLDELRTRLIEMRDQLNSKKR